MLGERGHSIQCDSARNRFVAASDEDHVKRSAHPKHGQWLDFTRSNRCVRNVATEFSRISFGNFCHSLGVLVLTAELAGSRPDVPAKNSREQVLVAEAGYAADVGDRLVCLDQVAFRRFDADAPNLGRRCAAHEPDKTLF